MEGMTLKDFLIDLNKFYENKNGEETKESEGTSL